MKYIIEGGTMWTNTKRKEMELLVEDGKIRGIRPTYSRYQYMRMNISPFIIAPTHVMMDDAPIDDWSNSQLKEHFIHHFLSKGCTTVLSVIPIRYEKDLSKQLNLRRTSLFNSPIDFLICPLVPPKVLTPSFVRTCKKLLIPAILVQLDEDGAWEDCPWGWIKEAIFPYLLVLIPYLPSSINDKQRKKILKRWDTVLKNEKITHYTQQIVPYTPIEERILKKIGVFPLRGNLMVGGEIIYNLYNQTTLNDSVPTDDPLLTVFKGQIIKIYDKIEYRPGFGTELKIKRPLYFQ
jgi:hypothetical protein